MYLSMKVFKDLVREALDGLPPEFAERVDNVSVTVEEEPREEDLRAVGLDPGEDTLFGLYHGIPLPERDLDFPPLPDRVVIYRRPILDACSSREEVVAEVRKTVLHELGHYFGLNEEEIPE